MIGRASSTKKEGTKFAVCPGLLMFFFPQKSCFYCRKEEKTKKNEKKNEERGLGDTLNFRYFCKGDFLSKK